MITRPKPRYVVITKNEVFFGKSLKDINKQLDSKLEHTELLRIGETWLVNLTEQNLDFVQDKKKLATAFIERLHKKDGTHTILLVIILILSFLSLVRG